MNLCKQCNKPFAVKESELRRGGGIFCSRLCSCNFIHTLHSPKPHNQNCNQCGTSFYRHPNRVLRNSQSGLVFCTRKCKDLAQRIENNHLSMRPLHYGDVSKDYRAIAFRHYQHECNLCGYKKFVNVLEVHHVDNDHSNNCLDNLKLVCPTCHAEIHHLISSV